MTKTTRWKAAVLAAGVLGGAGCDLFFRNSCVARGTKIRTRSGERGVEELVVGDEILSVDERTGETFSSPLTAIRTATRECVALEVGGRTLVATSDHPLFCPRDRVYAPAGDWVLGKRSVLLVRGEESSKEHPVTRAETFAGVHQVFDLTVAHPLHNFVANGVVVHNKSDPRATPPCLHRDGGLVLDEEGSSVEANRLCFCPDGSESHTECTSPRPDRCVCPDEPTDAGADAGIGPDAGEDAGSTDAGDGGS